MISFGSESVRMYHFASLLVFTFHEYIDLARPKLSGSHHGSSAIYIVRVISLVMDHIHGLSPLEPMDCIKHVKNGSISLTWSPPGKVSVAGSILYMACLFLRPSAAQLVPPSVIRPVY